MPVVPAPLYQLSVDGFSGEHFRVESFTGKESISEAYAFDLVVIADAATDEVERLALGQRACFQWTLGDHRRAFYGIVASVRLAEVHPVSHEVQYHLRLAPRLWLLKKRQRTRIFQGMRVHDIVSAVLAEAGIASRFQLESEYPVREYCTQYEESDHRFITRILAEAGIFFHFAAGPAIDVAALGDTAAGLIPGDTILGADTAAAYPPIGDDAGGATGAPPELQFLATPETTVSRLDKVIRFRFETTVRSSSATFRDYDPLMPQIRLECAASSTMPFGPAQLSSAGAVASKAAAGESEEANPAAATAVEGSAPEVDGRPALEVYEHHSPFLFPKWGFARDEAPRILRQKRRRAAVAQGESGCPDLAPGRRFALGGHPAPQLDRAYAVTTVEHRGQTRPRADGDLQTYANAFTCVPAEMTYVPPRPKRKSVQVSLTATVVGPGDEEIYVDALGQIRVQFHFDRDGRTDERSSCWIRTMQPWAGASWGHQFIPRVGTEVVVVFEGGDPDKPMVLGSLYNGTHPPPFALPADRTRSGIRTRSTPRSDGFNELSFEDAASAEQIYLHAQRNLDEVIEQDHSTDVGGSQSLRVEGAQRESIGRSQTLVVERDREVQVEGKQTTRVAGERRLSVEGDDGVEVAGDGSLTVARQYYHKSQGNFSLVVGTSTVTAQSDQYTNGTATLGASERVVVRALGSVLLACGDSSIELTEDKLTLRSPTIELKASKGITATGNGPSLSLNDKVMLVSKAVTIYSESAALELDKNATMKGEKLLLNCDAGSPSPPLPDDQKPPTQPFAVKLSDYFLKPLAGKKYHLMCEGLKYEGETDADGFVKQDIPASARQVLINLWLDTYPTGRQRLYVLSFGEVPAADTPRGAHLRLKHLGYLQGDPPEQMTAELGAALAEFQDDHRSSHGLEQTGELDGPTVGALTAVYGS